MQTIITSPPLVMNDPVIGQSTFLNIKDSCSAMVCLIALRRFYFVPVADVYYIELSETQWTDNSGWPIWLHRTDFNYWTWGHNRRCSGTSTWPADNWLRDNITIPKDTPTRFYFRLTYED